MHRVLPRGLLLERRHERVHVVLGRVEGAHPAHDALGLVPEVEPEPLLQPLAHVVRELGEDGAATAAATGSGAITMEIAGAVVRAERGVDLSWLRDVLRTVKAAT